jgi:DNA polymerase (family 10)
VTIVLDTDAPGVETLSNMTYAVATARRAWLTADQVANTRDRREFEALMKR